VGKVARVVIGVDVWIKVKLAISLGKEGHKWEVCRVLAHRNLDKVSEFTGRERGKDVFKKLAFFEHDGTFLCVMKLKRNLVVRVVKATNKVKHLCLQSKANKSEVRWL